MSSITINSNIASLNTQRRLGQSTNSLRSSFSRLSSGLRINRASDDAAGLAVSSLLKAERHVLTQGVRNLNDGISLLAVADGALAELSSVTVRLAELAEQASNGSLSSVQRKALDDEAQALREEYTRIAHSTEFNQRRLFDADFGDLRLQAGFGINEVTSNLGGAIGTGTLELENEVIVAGIGLDFSGIDVADLNGDGHQDAIIAGDFSDQGFANIALGNGDGSFTAISSFASGGDRTDDVSYGDFNGDGVLDLVTAGKTTTNDRTFTILLGNGDGSFNSATSFLSLVNVPNSAKTFVEVGDVNGDGLEDVVVQGGYYFNSVAVSFGNGDGSFQAARVFQGDTDDSHGVALVDLNGDAALDIVSLGVNNGANGSRTDIFINDGSGNFTDVATLLGDGLSTSGLTVGDINNDGFIDVGDNGSNGFHYFLGNGDGTFGNRQTLTTVSGSLVDINGDGVTDLVGLGVFLGDGEGGFESGIASPSGGLARSFADTNEDGVLDMINVSDGPFDARFRSVVSETDVGTAVLIDFSLRSQTDAKQSLALFEQKLNQLASQRGTIGAFESRLSTAIANSSVTAESIEAARSQITDVDVATESASLIRNSILQQAGVAILAQANQAPALAVQLLGNIS